MGDDERAVDQDRASDGRRKHHRHRLVARLRRQSARVGHRALPRLVFHSGKPTVPRRALRQVVPDGVHTDRASSE